MFFPHFLHNYKRKNKSPKILIIFPFCFVLFLFFLDQMLIFLYIDLWRFLYNKIFQMKDWGFQRKRWIS